MKSNQDLQKDVQDAIKWEPLLNAAEIGVTCKDGIVTLTGEVDSYMKKSEAETAAKNVVGVKAVVEKIEIKFDNNWAEKDDNQIAGEVVDALGWNWQLPVGAVKVKVEHGWVTLEGELEWNYLRDSAKNSVMNVFGIRGITNGIRIGSANHDLPERYKIESALARNWSLYDVDVHVSVSGAIVTLTGTVDSWYQKNEAERIAWKAPGVSAVDNEIIVEHAFELVD